MSVLKCLVKLSVKSATMRSTLLYTISMNRCLSLTTVRNDNGNNYCLSLGSMYDTMRYNSNTMEQNKMRGDKTMSQDIYDACQMVINNPDDLDADDIMDYIISNFDLAEIDFMLEVLNNVDVVRVREGLQNHIQAYVDSVTMNQDLGAIH